MIEEKFMGLTVHFKLSVPADLTEAEAKQIVGSLHRKAVRLQVEGWVDRVHPITLDPKILRKYATHWRFMKEPGNPRREHQIEVWPAMGFMFCVSVGNDCEPLWLGLCRYPETVRYDGRNVPTKAGPGWRHAGFSKTQFASVHGWEHFARCHCAVVHLLAACASPHLGVKISDEGEYWPRRSLKRLRENLDQMNGIMAGAAGALKDAFPGANGENAVQSPIFAHPQFEQLEAAGEARLGRKLQNLRAILGESKGAIR